MGRLRDRREVVAFAAEVVAGESNASYSMVIGDVLSRGWPLPNVWLGTSCEDQEAADERIPHLLRCPAAVRFLSCEPLLGAVNLKLGREVLTDLMDAEGRSERHRGTYPFVRV